MSTTLGYLPQYLVEFQAASLTTLTSRLVSCQIQRGRADELGAMQTGTCTLILDNGDGAFSPDNLSSPYAGYLVPGRIMRVSARFYTGGSWNPLFYGYVDSIKPQDNGPLDSNVIFTLVDWLGLQSIKTVNGTITSGGAGVHDLVKSFNSLMTIVDSAATFTFVNPTDGTSQHLVDYTLVSANALQALQDFAATVRGVVFAGREGTIRAAANGGQATTSLFNTYFVFDQPIQNPASNVVPYTNMDYDLTTQYLYNDITITAPSASGGAQNVQDGTSIAGYGKRSLAYTFQYMGSNQALPMATLLNYAYKDPHPRIHALEIDVDATTGVIAGGYYAADLLFQLELTAYVKVTKSQPGNLSISRLMVVEGIKHDIAPGFGGAGIMHKITLLLTERSEINPYWELGASQLGVNTMLGAGTAPFDATTISNCSLWLRADRGVSLTGGSTVTSWADQSGNGNTAIPVGTVTFASGVPVAMYMGSNSSYFHLAADPFAGTWTAFVVMARGGTPPAYIYDYLISGWDAGAGKHRLLSVYHDSGGDFAYVAETDGTYSAAAQDTVDMSGGIYPLWLVSGGSNTGLPVQAVTNGDAGVSANSAGVINATGTTNWAINFYNGTITDEYIYYYEIVVYKKVLTSSERAYVINGLNTKYLIY